MEKINNRTLEDKSIWFYVIEDLNLIKEQLLSVEGGAESDPVFTASAAYGITAQNISTWNSALQPSALNGYATESWVTSQNYATTSQLFSGNYNDLSNLPTLGTAAAQDSTAFATAAQGAEADTAVQPGDLATVATTGDYDDLINPAVDRVSGTVSLQLAGEELSWPTDITSGKIRLYNTTPGSTNTFYGIGIQNGEMIYQVDSNTSKHVFQGVDGSDTALPIAEMSVSAGIVSSVDLHMSEQKVINMGDPTDPRDGVNLQTLDGRLSTAQRTAIDALTVIADPTNSTLEANANKINDIINALKAV